MKRALRLLILLIIATVFSTRLPINLIIIIVAAVSMDDFKMGDLIAIFFGSLCIDHFNMLPLGFSVLPLFAMVSLIYMLKAQIYVHALISRLLWLSCAVFVFYIINGTLLMARTGNIVYLWNGMGWGLIHATVEGSLAAMLSPWVHRYLTMSLEDLRQDQSIVVP